MARNLWRSATASAVMLAAAAAWNAAEAYTVRECESISSNCSTLCNRYAANATIAGQCVGNCLMKELSCKSNASDRDAVFGNGGVTLFEQPPTPTTPPKRPLVKAAPLGTALSQ